MLDGTRRSAHNVAVSIRTGIGRGTTTPSSTSGRYKAAAQIIDGLAHTGQRINDCIPTWTKRVHCLDARGDGRDHGDQLFNRLPREVVGVRHERAGNAATFRIAPIGDTPGREFVAS